jgi:hypothetical protein
MSRSSVGWITVKVGSAITATTGGCENDTTSCRSSTASNERSEQGTMEVLDISNPNVQLPWSSVAVCPSLVSDSQARALDQELVARRATDSKWYGFDGPRRRVQRYSFRDGDNHAHLPLPPPPTLVAIQQQLYQQTGLLATDVTVEEYTPLAHRPTELAAYDPSILSTFYAPPRTRHNHNCPCQSSPPSATSTSNESIPIDPTSKCSCFVLEIPLVIPQAPNDETESSLCFPELVQNWNQPAQQHAMCWNLQSTQHYTYVRLRHGVGMVKQGPMLWDWRSSRALAVQSVDLDSVIGEEVAPIVVRMLQFYRLATPEGEDNVLAEGEPNDRTDSFGHVPTQQGETERLRRLVEPVPPLGDLLTIIVTTSPIKSNPSTEVIERAMGTFVFGGLEFAYQCRKIIVCDGFRTQESEEVLPVSQGAERPHNKVSRRHNNDKQAMRNGIVTSQQADNYRQYKQNLRQLIADASQREQPSVFSNARLVELEERHGYGFALRHVLRNCIDTPFVCVVQHDRTFMRPTPVMATVHAMWYHTKVKYVGFSMRSNLMYRDIFLGKYGGGLHQQQQQEWNDMVLYLPQLCLSVTEYGPDGAPTEIMHVSSEKIRQNVVALAETYRGSAQAAVKKPASEENQCQLSLVPTMYWYDNVHVCDTKHYRDFVFDPSYKMCARGGFVEDKLSPVLKRTVERLGLKDGHSRFGCYLLDDHSGYFFTGHIDGGSYMSEKDRKELRASQNVTVREEQA